MPNPLIKIGGTTREAVPGTLNVSASLGNRATLDAMVQSPLGTYRPTPGDGIELWEGASKLWAGSVDEVHEVSLTEAAPTFRRYAIRGVTWEQYLERRYCWDVANGRPLRYSRNFELTADPVTDTLTTTVAHGRSNGDRVRVRAHANGTLAGGLDATIDYYVVNAGTTTLKLSLTSGGAAVNITSAGTLEQILITNRAGEIVSALLVDAATSEPIGDTNVALGAVVDTVIFPTDMTVASAINQLAEASGFAWWIDEERELYFQPRTFTTAAFSLSGTSGNYRNFSVRRTREDKVNAALMRVDMSAVGYEEESFAGNGTATKWTLTYPVGQIVAILLNGQEVQSGIWLADSDSAYYYEEGTADIRQDPDEAVLTSSDTLIVRYRKFGANHIYTDDSADISTTATAEGNSGIYQGVFDRAGIGLVQALAEGDAIVAERKKVVAEIEYETDQQIESTCSQLRPGQLQTIANSFFSVTSGTYLIREVSITDVFGLWLRFGVKAIDATRFTGVVDYWKGMASGGSGSGAAVGSGGVSGSGGGAGTTFVHEVTLTANTTISTPYAASAGARLTVFVVQGAGPYTISFDATEFAQVVNTNIAPTSGSVTAFEFAGRADGLWWPCAMPITGMI